MAIVKRLQQNKGHKKNGGVESLAIETISCQFEVEVLLDLWITEYPWVKGNYFSIPEMAIVEEEPLLLPCNIMLYGVFVDDVNAVLIELYILEIIL